MLAQATPFVSAQGQVVDGLCTHVYGHTYKGSVKGPLHKCCGGSVASCQEASGTRVRPAVAVVELACEVDRGSWSLYALHLRGPRFCGNSRCGGGLPHSVPAAAARDYMEAAVQAVRSVWCKLADTANAWPRGLGTSGYQAWLRDAGERHTRMSGTTLQT